MTGALTQDEFLGGRLCLSQPKNGYRAGIDPVLLAASVTARPTDTVLDLGCGVGAAALCLATRVNGISLTGLELQPDYAALARQNAQANGIAMDVIDGDLSQMPPQLKDRQFDHVITNPPYFDRTSSTPAQNKDRETALGETVSLSEWIAAAAKRTRPKGYVTMIQRADRLPTLLRHAADHLGSLEVVPLIPRPGRQAKLVILRGRREGRAEFRLHDGWCLHDGHAHPGDRENYTDATACVLRDGAALHVFS